METDIDTYDSLRRRVLEILADMQQQYRRNIPLWVRISRVCCGEEIGITIIGIHLLRECIGSVTEVEPFGGTDRNLQVFMFLETRVSETFAIIQSVHIPQA